MTAIYDLMKNINSSTISYLDLASSVILFTCKIFGIRLLSTLVAKQSITSSYWLLHLCTSYLTAIFILVGSGFVISKYEHISRRTNKPYSNSVQPTHQQGQVSEKIICEEKSGTNLIYL